MFGKEQPEITNEKDVGDYIDELKRQGTTELNTFILEEEDELVGTSTDTSCKRENND
ncbi:hypothetical protein vBAspPH44_10 [Alteromonas phage vB_AspP-H4/4]|jgi:hypothetical protein|uniref:Uncharacterized protein n=1 Tax=Alteromonas phage vB_AspP-H4/4 TaxID=2928692 RepID=A0A220YL45_9CAUD|nr:hypothetical protein HOR85_gp10 [Alteromonas phage vB_AspP-H4/4]ASL24393.1 hypothetical protein vBAspPH44_10 [Alteromonas phage vB_AspP-H4/4]